MAAKDYKICTAIFDAYISKVSKRNPNMMLDDRREITEEEILMLVDWYLNKEAEEGEHGISFESNTRGGMRVQMKFVKIE